MKRGNRPEGPRGGKGVPGLGSAGGFVVGVSGFFVLLHETWAASEAGEGSAWLGAHDARAPNRHRVAARGVPAYPQGRRGGRGRADRGRVRDASGGQPP